MSPKLGPLSYAGDDCQPLALRPFSEETAALIDQEAKRIVEECQVEAQRLLEQNRQEA
jgi:ATP-dependent Zn protease